MLIYLRHGDDRGNDLYQHDRPLNTHGKHEAGKEARHLIEKYEHPNRVCFSPFRRARETLEAMATCFRRPVEVHQDPRIAQHLSKKQQRAPQISPETLKLITIHEDEETFQRRVSDHVRVARAWTGTIWCITHQTVIEKIAPHFGMKAPRRLDFLDYVVMLR
jgi:phosphohistidine phosphatase SixA